jgi:hypothetical protein
MNRRTFAKLAGAVFLFAFSAVAQTAVPWLTRSHDNQRSGWNSQETVLTQASVAKGIFLKTIIPVYGDKRGVEAQPLIVPNVPVPCTLVTKPSQVDASCATAVVYKDVMVLCSMANQCRGVDAHTGADIWDVTLGMPVTGGPSIGGPSIDSHGINQFWGPLSTGVIDAADNRFYQVFWMSPDGSGSPRTARFYMAVLNVATGASVVPPVMIAGISNGYDFNALMRKARSSAVLINQHGARTVLQCTGTVSESGGGANGFCFAFDTLLNTITAMATTTNGEGAGIWEAGQGLSCDNTYCYAVTGNGDFDGVTQWGESFIQLQYTPPTATTAASLTINKGWSPWTDFQRSGQAQVPAGKLAGMSMPSEAAKPVGGGMNVSFAGAKLVANLTSAGVPVTLVYPNMASGNWSDEDWGSSGPACIFQIGVCVAAGKDGTAYSLSVPGFVGTTAADVGTKANCGKLASPPVWFTVDPGPLDPCPINPTSLNVFPNGYSAHLHATPVQFLNPITNTWNLAAGGENAQVHVWNVSNTGALSYLGEGNEFASSDLRGRPPGGMTGSMCAGSSNGNIANTYLLYCVQPYGDSNAAVVPGHLIIYDPIHLTNGVMPTLWDSGNWGAHDPNSQWYCMMDKFLPPIVDAGEIIEPCYDGRVMVLMAGN